MIRVPFQHNGKAIHSPSFCRLQARSYCTCKMNEEEEVRHFEDALRREKSGDNENKLICGCPSHLSGVERCRMGKFIQIASRYWAGNAKNNNIPEPPDRSEMQDLSRSEFISLGYDPDGTADQAAGGFGLALCENGQCSTHDRKPWWLHEVSPCKEGLNRAGPLCGMCRNGTSLKIASGVSFMLGEAWCFYFCFLFELEFVSSILRSILTNCESGSVVCCA